MNQNESMIAKETSTKDTEFHPVIVQTNDSFCVYLPEWNVSGEGQSLEDAYQQFIINKKNIDLRNEKFGLANLSPEPNPRFINKSLYRELALSFMKSGISVFSIVLVVVLLLPNIGAVFSNQVKNIVPVEYRNAKFWAIQLPKKLNAQLDRLSSEEEKLMHKEWDKFYKRTTPLMGPFINNFPRRKILHP